MSNKDAPQAQESKTQELKTEVILPAEGNGKTPPQTAKKPAGLNFGKTTQAKTGASVAGKSPFKKARSMVRRLKIFFWGDSGVGKSTLALQFPKPVVIDMESGTELYGGVFDFDVLHAADADEVMAAVDWLLANRHEYRTLVIDPITIYWEALQKKWSDIFLQRNKSSKGYKFDYYDLQPKDWLTIKAELKELVRKLLTLDMNVIVTAREKTKYKDGSYMVAAGETFDAEKSLPYMFDSVLRLYKDERGRHMARCLKDRSNHLPKDDFECSYQLFEDLFGKENLYRQAKPVEYADEGQKAKIAEYIRRFGTIIKRQDEGLIIKNCHLIKNGKDIELGNSTAKDFFFMQREDEESIRETVLELTARRLPQSYQADPLRDIQIITPLREKTKLSCKALNELCQARLNPSPKIDKCPFKSGDKVIQCKNDYEKEIVNGDIGYIKGIDKNERLISVRFENPSRLVSLPLYGNDLELAYACTCHRLQGSEAPIVIIPVHKCFGTLIMQRNWIYTAISRAKKVCVLVGRVEEIPKIIKRNQQQKRFTNLAEFLREKED